MKPVLPGLAATSYRKGRPYMAKVKVASEMIFERHEKKYLLSQGQYGMLIKPLLEHIGEDEYGLHTVCSLYYDTDDYLLARRSLDKPAYKEKLRLRSYGAPSPEDTVYLELKKKLNGISYKRRVPMTLHDAMQCSYGATLEHSGQILDEIGWFIQRYHLTPKVMLFYERIALYGADDSRLRITFDQNIRWRDERLNFADGDYGTRLLPPGEYLMEIKLPGAFPCWMSRLLSEQGIYPVSFSKYGKVYSEIMALRGSQLVG